jgi:thioredoxin reductase (NADPH)
MPENTQQRLIIVGGGPSAWAAATYAARADLQPLVLAGEKVGGQLMLTTEVENFPGFAEGVDGPTLMMQMRQQAERFGARVREETVTKIETDAKPFGITTTLNTYTAEAVLIATGAETVWLGVPGEKELIGRGVSSCAVCDAAFFRNKKTVVVGGGDAAMEDALALIKFAESVTIIHRRDQFRASKIMADRVLNNPKVKVYWNSVVEQVGGEDRVSGIVIRDVATQIKTELPVEGVFVAIGHKPATAWLPEAVKVNQKGFIITRLGLERLSLEAARQAITEEGLIAYPTMTSVEGIFAAGDCVDFRYKQAVTAAAYGVMGALDAQWWLESRV